MAAASPDDGLDGTTRTALYRATETPKPTDGTLMRPEAVPNSNKSTVLPHEKRPRLERDRALEESKSMTQSELDDYQYSGEHPWRDEKTLRRLFVDEGLTGAEIGERLGCAKPTAHKWLRRFDIERPRPWQEEGVLRRLYVEKRMTQDEIGERFGVGRWTIRHWMKEHDIERRGKEWGAMKPYAIYYTDDDGYEVWESGSEKLDNSAKVSVHRLAAVAWFGFDAVKDNHVHHKNGHRLDNRESNLKPMTVSDHSSHHSRERWARDVSGWVNR